MSFDKIYKTATSLASALEGNEKLVTPVLVVKANQFLKDYPYDQTLGGIARVLEKMADNNAVFITRADFRNLYKKLYSRNTKVAQLFQEELKLTETPSTVTFAPETSATEIDPYQTGDSVLASALESVFDKNAPLKMYSKNAANRAIKSVSSSLDAWNLKASSISIESGNEKFIVVKADYDTPKGKTSFYVPVEVSKDSVIEPSVFMGNKGPQELNHNSIKSYITNNAGSKLNVNGTIILDTLTAAASDNKQVTELELAVTKLNASKRSNNEFFSGQIVGQKLATAAVKDVETPKSDEFKSFEDTFSSPYGVAAFTFGERNVKNGMHNIFRELTGFGYKHAQVTVLKSDANNIFYAVSLNDGRIGFTVPVKVSNGKLNAPAILICQGSAKAFDKDGVRSLFADNQSDFKVAAAASPQFGLKPSDLINNIREAVAEGNHAKAEDALNILASKNDAKAYAVGFNIYKDTLLAKKAEPETSCSMIVKSSSSTQPICAHTGLPTNKVYQDQYGNCLPLYRRGMDETYEGASFLNAKIFG